jgi:hypothetical protein
MLIVISVLAGAGGDGGLIYFTLQGISRYISQITALLDHTNFLEEITVT